MWTAALTRLRARVILALLTVALAAIGFAHRVPTAELATSEALVLAGFDLSSLCSEAGDSSGTQRHVDCPACHIVGDADLPDGPDVVRPAGLGPVAMVTAPRENRVARPVLDPAHGLRAPPLA